MCIATSLSSTGVHGTADVAFTGIGDQTRLSGLYQRAPLRFLFPRVGKADSVTAVLVTTSGGLVGGDVVDVSASAGEGSRALVTAQAAEKIYRSAGDDCRVSVRLKVGSGGWLEWLPQETILFEGARLRRVTELDFDDGGRAMAGEILVFGRVASGETVTRGLVRDAWAVRRCGRLVWADAIQLEGEIADRLAAPSCLNGAVAAATMVYAGDDTREHLEAARSLLARYVDTETLAGATVVGGLLIVRWLGYDTLALRTAYGAFWIAFRRHVRGGNEDLPRVWCM
jgi:urease accessory protein